MQISGSTLNDHLKLFEFSALLNKESDAKAGKPVSVLMQSPSANIEESGEAFNIVLAAPGFKKSDFKIRLRENILVVSVERDAEKNEADVKYVIREFAYNIFSRSFILPQIINVDKIKAIYIDGILRVCIPKNV